MKRVLRDVVLGAVSCVATVGAGSGVLMAAATDALAQDTTTTTTTTTTTAPPTSPAPTTQAQTPAPQARTPAPSRTRAPGQRPATQAGQRQAAAPAPGALPRSSASSCKAISGSAGDRHLVSAYPSRRHLRSGTGRPLAEDAFATGLFADVQIEQRGGDLVVSVIENPIINRVIFEGLHTLKEDDLENEVQARPRSVFTPSRAQADVQRIIELIAARPFRRAGHAASCANSTRTASISFSKSTKARPPAFAIFVHRQPRLFRSHAARCDRHAPVQLVEPFPEQRQLRS